MKHPILLFFVFVSGIFLTSAQTLTPSDIWYKLIPNKMNTDNFLTQKGFKMKYSGPKKLGGNISCYFNKKADEWLFIHDDEQWRTTSVSYLLPTLKKYKNNLIEKKLLSQGEEVSPMGKTSQENKIYYQLVYAFEKYSVPPVKE